MKKRYQIMVSQTSSLASSYTTSKRIYHPHYDVTKPNEQHQFDLLYMPHNLFEGNTYKYILTGIDIRSPDPLEPKNQVKLHLCWKQSIKRVVCSNILTEFKNKVTKLLENTTLIFEEQQQNISTPIRPLWKPLTKSWQNCCLNQWMFKSFKTLKKYQRFG